MCIVLLVKAGPASAFDPIALAPTLASPSFAANLSGIRGPWKTVMYAGTCGRLRGDFWKLFSGPPFHHTPPCALNHFKAPRRYAGKVFLEPPRQDCEPRFSTHSPFPPLPSPEATNFGFLKLYP